MRILRMPCGYGEIRFAGIHVFRYSPRAGTRAAEFPEQISGSVKKARMEQAQSLAKASKFAFFKAQIGKTFPVLFERERGDGYHIGHAPNGAVIRVFAEKSKKSLRNRIFCVRIEENDADCCYGTLVHRTQLTVLHLLPPCQIHDKKEFYHVRFSYLC